MALEAEVDAARFGAQRLHRALGARPVLEGIEPEMPERVLVRDLVHLVVWNAGDAFGKPFGRARPGGVRVWIVTLPGDRVDADLVPEPDPDRVIDEASNDVLPK